MSTRVIIGDDAATNHKISDTALSNLKSIVSEDPLSVNVKYSHNTIVKTRALFIQGTNTDISFFENNPAIKARTLVINWTDTDFRSKASELTFELDTLMKDQLFIDVLAEICLEKVDFFKQFDIPEKVTKATDDMIESNDSILQFLNEIYTSIDGFEFIPCQILYSSYVKWLKVNNPKGGIMKSHSFAKSLSRYEDIFHFKVSSKDDRRRFQSHPQMRSLMNILDDEENSIKLKLPQYFLITDNPITTEELENFNPDLKSVDELTDRESQIARLLIFQYQRTDVMSKYRHLIS